ncbi:MAG: tetratricopeptide repeat protein [Myxococcota bacterium]
MKIQRFALSVAVSATLSASAWAAELDPISPGDVKERLDGVDTEVAKAKADLAAVTSAMGQASASPQAKADRRIREAEIDFLLNDYLRAAVLLMDVVDVDSNRSNPRYDDAVFYLAESLRYLQNYSESRKYYERELPLANGDRLKAIVLGLIEIANATKHFESVENYVARLRQAGGLSAPEVDYIHAKTLYLSSGGELSKLDNAYRTFKQVPSGTSVSAQAAYYAGVVRVKQNKLAESIPEFQEALGRTGKSEEQKAIRDLAQLSLGRVYFELGKLPEAVAAYTAIGRSSPQFQDMLFEVAWAHVKSAKDITDEAKKTEALTKALQMAELLMASAPDTKMFPEARILEGNLQIRLGIEENAYDTFQGLIDRYEGARTLLGDLMARNPDPRQFFDQLVGADMAHTTATEFLPPVAVEWAVNVPAMKQAVGVLSDLKQSEQYTDESRELIDTLSMALRGEQRFNVGGLGVARQLAYGVENRIVLANSVLLSIERRMILPFVPATDRANLDSRQAVRNALEAELSNLPRSSTDVAKSSASIVDEYRSAEHRVFKQGILVAAMRAQLAAIDVWLGQNLEQIGKDGVEAYRKSLADARAEVDAMEKDLSALGREVRTGAEVAAGDGGQAHARAVRQAYAEVLSQESALLAAQRSRLPADLAGLTGRIDGQRAALAQFTQELSQDQDRMESAVRARVEDLIAMVEAERAKLDGYGQEHGVLRGETDGLLGPVATDTLKTVAHEFQDLVLKADVGIIDVAWARKQGVTDKVSNVVREQQDRTRELETEFQDVLEGN